MGANGMYITLTEQNFQTEVVQTPSRSWWISGLTGAGRVMPLPQPLKSWRLTF